MSEKKKQLFFSHTWRPDNEGRNTHSRVHNLVKKIREKGWTTWFDEEDMGGNIDAAMAQGIDGAQAIIICLTESYFKKVNETAKDPRKRDNCLKEWTYANARNKFMMPVVMEPCLLDTMNWPAGIVSLYLGSTLYVDASDDNLDKAVESIIKFLYQEELQPDINKKSINSKIMQHRPPPPPPLPSPLQSSPSRKMLPPLLKLPSSLLPTLFKSKNLDESSTDIPLSRSYTRKYTKRKIEVPQRSLSLSDKSDNIPNNKNLLLRRWHSTSNLKEVVL